MNQMIIEGQDSKTQTEAVYDIEKVFMSRTDLRGVIRYVNDEFSRISQYNPDELVGAPHKIVRHPDMPKALFYTYWKAIKAGQPIGAYVKNQCKNGGFYWVFMIAVPVEDGYLSIRFKPTSAIFDVISEEYAQHRQLERAENLDAEASAARFDKRLQELGYTSYESFMAIAIAAELKSRMLALRRKIPTSFDTVHALVPVWDEVKKSSAGVFEAYQSIRVTPLNMQTQAGKLNEDGKPLAVIATNFAILSDDMAEMMASFEEQSAAVLKSIYENLFLLASVLILNETVHVIKETELAGDLTSRDADIENLTQQARVSETNSQDAIRLIARQLNSFVDLIGRVQIILSGLSMTRVMCEIEAENLGETNARFAGILNELHLFQKRTDSCMRSLQGELRKGQRMLNRKH